ncbi:uncharacterized protein LOC117497101 isoform X2 [Trematomus bernacchii]|uniref:uncharacterized protein LOC117497101 isoform X2 n=1 Tax=Trematomus bernacchii TaxID=40690 RepID=UPI00146F6F25|nr:uncharacterized protein LOC117497101 isoform X2 [Trematomus bernacchii]
MDRNSSSKMSQSSTEEPPELNTWTKEDVHHWLMNVVKVPQSCADSFLEEKMNGIALNEIEKSEILEFKIPHGPAVKISHYLERLKKGSQHESQFPAEVENWTKEEVAQWLVGHVKVDGKEAERFKEEEVSGDCLVCFKKQDFRDLGLKRGPALNILKELKRLRIQESTPPSRIRSFSMGKNKQAGKRLPMERKTTEVTFQKPAPLIKDTLDGLSTTDFTSFKFHLNNYTDPKCKAIPQCKLEGKDTSDIATVVTNHYGPDKALRVTHEVLIKINRRDLADQLQSHMGLVEVRQKPCVDEDKATQSHSSSWSRSEFTSRKNKKKKKKSSCFNFNGNLTLFKCCSP